MTILISIVCVALALLLSYFLFNYIEELSIIFCIGLERYNYLIGLANVFSKFEVILMIIISAICSILICYLTELKLLLFVLGYAMIIGILKSWNIKKYLNNINK